MQALLLPGRAGPARRAGIEPAVEAIGEFVPHYQALHINRCMYLHHHTLSSVHWHAVLHFAECIVFTMATGSSYDRESMCRIEITSRLHIKQRSE